VLTKLFIQVSLALTSIIPSIPAPEPAAFLWCVGQSGAPGHAPGPGGKCDDGTILMECPDKQPDDGSLVNCQPPRTASTLGEPCEQPFGTAADAAAMGCDGDGCCFLMSGGDWACIPKGTADCASGSIEESCPSGTCWAAGPLCRVQGPDPSDGFGAACCYGPGY
jgi:hypothetical protein